MWIDSVVARPVFGWRKLCFGSNPKKTLARVLLWSVVSVLFFHHLLLPIRIIGSSMSPTYRHGSVNFINRFAYTCTWPKRGDVVALRKDGEVLLKRIIGLPGERIVISDGTIWINGHALDDRFAGAKVMSDMTCLSLNQEEYFVIGDNRQTSYYGKITREEIVGKIVF